MLKRNFPLILLLFVFIAMLDVIYCIPRTSPVEAPSVVPEQATGESFRGRVLMPSLDDIYVLDNSSGRDLVQLERFLQGRAAGLHYLASAHFKAARKNGRPKDITLGLRMELDSLGQFRVAEVTFADTDDEAFLDLLQEHVKKFWRYPRSTAGKLDFWIPIRWLAQY